MNDQQHGHGHYQQNGYGGDGDSRDRRDEYASSQYHHQQQHHINGQQSGPTSGSPPPTASPFAFAPPPLSAQGQSSRPPLPLHHSDPTPASAAQQAYPQYYQKAALPPPPAPTHSYPYATQGGTSMSYRSYSGDSPRQSAAAPPSQSPVPRNAYPSSGANSAPMQSPTSATAYPPYQRHDSGMYPPGPGMSNSPHASSPQRPNMYSSSNYYASAQGYQPQASEMPRSLSFPSNYPQAGYPAYMPPGGSMMGHPHLARHNTTNSIGEGLAGIDLSRPSLGYSFANRLPLVDRPFKCDECVQSFNRNHDLKRHKRIHLSVKPFGCDKCGKTFSRKDALRRHWLVKGCRGEDGATAPITPMYPINSNPPALSPSPPNVSPPDAGRQFPPPLSYSHPSAPPPLDSLPARAPSTQSQVLVTPNEAAMGRPSVSNGIHAPIPRPLEEPLIIDPSIDPSLAAPAAGGPMGQDGGADGYFEGVVGIKQDGTALIDKAQGHSGHLDSPYSRYPTSPQNSIHPHPYRRPNGVHSPVKAHQHMGQDQKPVFAMPFAPGQSQYDNGHMANGEGIPMEKQGSGPQEDDEPKGWQRWHRPSFPFPPAGGVNYHHQPQYDGNSPVEAQPQQAYA